MKDKKTIGNIEGKLGNTRRLTEKKVILEAQERLSKEGECRPSFPTTGTEKRYPNIKKEKKEKKKKKKKKKKTPLGLGEAP